MSYGISALVTAISNDVTGALAAAGYAALTDGKILLGRQHQFEQSAPPRIIMTPVASSFDARRSSSGAYLPFATGNASTGVPVLSVSMLSYGGSYVTPVVAFSGGGGSGAEAAATVVNGAIARINLTSAGSGYTTAPTITITDTGGGTGATALANLSPYTEMLTQSLQPDIYTETVVLEVRCWGATPTTDSPDSDFDYTQVLYQQVIRSCRGLAVGAFRPGSRGEWTDASFQSAQLFRNGREFVFQIELDVPILSLLLTAAPVGTLGKETVTEGSDSVVID
jgi:hypothetical protein